MKKSILSYLGMAVLTGVLLLSLNAAFGATTPELDPPADAVKPTFTGINFVGDKNVTIDGVPGQANQVLGIVSGVLGWTTGGADIDWTINGTDMYSGVSGNVGIGTNAPTSKLQITDGDTLKIGKDLFGQTGMSLQTGDLNMNIGTKGNRDMTFYSNNQERMRLKGNGDLEVQGSLINPSGVLGIQIDDILRVANEVGFGGPAITTVNLALHSAGGAGLLFRTNNAGANQKVKYIGTDSNGMITIGKLTDLYQNSTALVTIAQNGDTDVGGKLTADSVGTYTIESRSFTVAPSTGGGQVYSCPSGYIAVSCGEKLVWSGSSTRLYVASYPYSASSCYITYFNPSVSNQTATGYANCFNPAL